MENQTLLTIFTAIVAVALLLQSLAFMGIYRSIRNLSSRLDRLSTDFMKSVNALSGQVEEALASIKAAAEKVQALQESISLTNAVVLKQVVNLDSFLQEITDAARLQILRVQDIVDTASRKVENAFESLHHGALAPVHEVNAIVRGIRVGLDVLLRRRMSPSAASRQDEELFI